ncbi:MAG: Adenylosuccinate synthetase [Chlamydiae bacterium]|nr:Adenylosuccinate synthetase [Chlamydiota bacterium]
MPRILVVGSQWGDEGKGKIIDILAQESEWIVRSQGGNNAGHTIVIGTQEYKLHLIPTGILQTNTKCAIAAGTVIDPIVLVEEMKTLQTRGITFENRFWISPSAHIIMPYHKIMDTLQEKRKGNVAIGTTKRGIGPCYCDKINRIGIRMCDLVDSKQFETILTSVLKLKNEELTKLYSKEPLAFKEVYEEYMALAEILRPYVRDINPMLHKETESHKTILFEGAQGTFLDVTSGTYPYVTSSNTTAAGICSGAEIGPNTIDHVLGVMKVYSTRVGNGPFPTEISSHPYFNPMDAREMGTTTGRQRRMGWFDAVLAKASVNINGISSLAMTKLDILDQFDEIKICVGYEFQGKIHLTPPPEIHLWDQIKPQYETLPGWKSPTTHITNYEQLPDNAKKYLNRISELCQTPISMISVGPEREQIVVVYSPIGQKLGV